MSSFILILVIIILSPVILISAIMSVFIIYTVIAGIIGMIKESDEGG